MTVPASGWEPGPIRGFQRWSEPGRILVVADRWVDAVSKLGLAQGVHLWRASPAERSGRESVNGSGQGPANDPEAGSRNSPIGSSVVDGTPGRGPTTVVPLPGSDSHLHLRPVRHGGWFGSLLGESLLGLGRPFDELRVTASLAERGAPVPNPALVFAERSGPFWNATVGTIFEPDTVDGIAFLSGAPAPDAVLRAAAAAGRAIACFHELGGSHRDLHIGNLLIRTRPDGESEVVVVDLDRARHIESVKPSVRMRELMRLRRSLIKRRFTESIGARGLARFFAAYTGNDRRLRGELLSYLGREQRRIARHAVFYPSKP